MGTKEIPRKPSIQPPNKARAKHPLPPATTDSRATGRGLRAAESPLLNRALKRGEPFTGCCPLGAGIVPFPNKLSSIED